jgi:hypothetical protein
MVKVYHDTPRRTSDQSPKQESLRQPIEQWSISRWRYFLHLLFAILVSILKCTKLLATNVTVV